MRNLAEEGAHEGLREMRKALSGTNPGAGRKIRVMLIDDRTVFLRTVSTYLRRVSEVELVGIIPGDEDAVTQARLLGAQIVILGLRISGVYGLEIIARLHAVYPKIGVIVLTLRDMVPYRRAALDAGASDFVSRVSAGKDLLPAIRRVAAAVKESNRPKVIASARHRAVESSTRG